MIGLVGGLGIGAGIHYYRELAANHDDASRRLDLAIVHAEMSKVIGAVADGDRQGLARYLAGILAQLKGAGATIGVIPAVTPHCCIDDLTPISPLPLVNLLDVTASALAERRLTRVALFGTRFVVATDMFGKLPAVDVVRPREDEIDLVHGIYSRVARTGIGSADDHRRLSELAKTLCRRDGVDAIVLAGTDLSSIFDESNTTFPYLDCARAHIQAIMRT